MGLKIKKGDTVLVISGQHRPSEGNMVRGKVLAVLPKSGRALIEGVNMVKKHAKAKSQQQPGGIIEKEAPIRLSKLMLVDPKTGIASRYTNEKDDKGNKIRRSKKSKNEV